MGEVRFSCAFWADQQEFARGPVLPALDHRDSACIIGRDEKIVAPERLEGGEIKGQLACHQLLSSSRVVACSAARRAALERGLLLPSRPW